MFMTGLIREEIFEVEFVSQREQLKRLVQIHAYNATISKKNPLKPCTNRYLNSP